MNARTCFIVGLIILFGGLSYGLMGVRAFIASDGGSTSILSETPHDCPAARSGRTATAVALVVAGAVALLASGVVSYIESTEPPPPTAV